MRLREGMWIAATKYGIRGIKTKSGQNLVTLI